MGDATFPGVRLKAAIGSAVLATFLSGCLFDDGGGGRKAVKVKIELLRTEGKAAVPKPGAASGTAVGAGPAWSSDLSIASLKVPILKISLHNAAFTREADLYVCPGSGSECLVEAAGEALQNELDADPVMVEQGDYRYLYVKTCEDSETEYISGVTATVALAGRTWYTHPTSVLDSSGPARPLFIRTSGCGRTYALPRPLVIDDSLGPEITFKIYFDIGGIAYAALGSNATLSAWTSDNCAGDRPAARDSAGPPFLCIAYPDLAGLADTAAVALERYRLNGSVTLGLFFSGGSDLPVGGYLRRFYGEGAIADPGFRLAVFGSAVTRSTRFGAAGYGSALPIRDLRKNGDGTLYLAAFGDGPQGMDGSAFRVYAFQRGGHSGVFSALPDTAGVLATGTYTAVPLAP